MDAKETEKQENVVGKVIVACAIEVHRTLGGPGLLESVYEEALAWELRERGLSVERQVSVSIRYKGQSLEKTLFVDMIVGGLVIVENKATTEYTTVFESQTLTCFRLSGPKRGMVIDFGERFVKDGIHRVVNGL